MKKNSIFKGLFIAAILCALVVSACKEPDPQKKITVTGIPSQHNGRIGVTAITTMSSDDIFMSDFVTISGGTVTTSLFEGSSLSVPFTGSGTYMVMFLIFDTINSPEARWTGVILSKAITSETTTIPFSEFMVYSPSVQQTPLSVKDVLKEILKQYE